MELLVLRHATAEVRAPGTPDADRRLTPRGRKRFRLAARGLARLLEAPDVILTSPLPRARETAEITARAWKGPEPVEAPPLAGGAVDDVLGLLDGLRTRGRVALVGHEPQVSEIVARLLGSPHAERLGFRKGGAALLELPERPSDGGRLVWQLPPRILRALAR